MSQFTKINWNYHFTPHEGLRLMVTANDTPKFSVLMPEKGKQPEEFATPYHFVWTKIVNKCKREFPYGFVMPQAPNADGQQTDQSIMFTSEDGVWGSLQVNSNAI